MSPAEWLRGRIAECCDLAELDLVGDDIARLIPEGDASLTRRHMDGAVVRAYFTLVDLWAHRRSQLMEEVG